MVSAAIDEMGIHRLLERYRVGDGASRYNPVMMTKLFVAVVKYNTYRKEKSLKWQEDIFRVDNANHANTAGRKNSVPKQRGTSHRTKQTNTAT